MSKDKLISNLRTLAVYHNEQEYHDKLYLHLTDSVWFNDKDITSKTEQERFLYEAFIKYYDIIANGEVRETENWNDDFDKVRLNRFLLINLCKNQLDRELNKLNS